MIEPYYVDDAVTIYLGDAREVLPSIDCGDVAATITDPPYGETSLAWDRWPPGWVAAVAAATSLRAPLWCFGSMRMFLEHSDEFAGWAFAQDVVWEKHNGSSFHADRFRRVHEHAVQWYRGAWADVIKQTVMTPDATARAVRRKEKPTHLGAIEGSTYRSEDGGPRMARSVLFVPSCHGYAIHPTQKPVGIVAPLIEYSTTGGGDRAGSVHGVGLDAARCEGPRSACHRDRAERGRLRARRRAHGPGGSGAVSVHPGEHGEDCPTCAAWVAEQERLRRLSAPERLAGSIEWDRETRRSADAEREPREQTDGT